MRTSKRDRARQYVVGLCLFLGYVGVYLCRKNLAVAIPLLQRAFRASKADVGKIASAGDIAYTIGKFAWGPIIDRGSGRAGFLVALAGQTFNTPLLFAGVLVFAVAGVVLIGGLKRLEQNLAPWRAAQIE